MNDKKNILPIIIASVIALVITAMVKLILPGGSIANPTPGKKEISMPEIPLMVKETKKRVEVQVLIVSKNIKKDQKITLDSLSWKTWPLDAVQSYFIAKDEKGTALNNGADYSNALKMWAASDIPSNVPLTMGMLTQEDPVVKAQALKKKQEEESKRQEREKKAKSFIEKGKRAVTFPIDQKSPSSSSMMSPGDLIDVLIMEQKGNKSITHTYRAIKILAIDGITKIESKKEKSSLGGINLGAVGGLLTPRNVTLEVKEELVEIMLKQAGNTGVIMSLRSQDEETFGAGEESVGSEEEQVREALLQNIISVNKVSSAEAMLKAKQQKELEEKNLSMLISNMNSANNNDSSSGAVSPKRKKLSRTGGKIEFVSGKTVGDEEEPEKKSVIVYRKLTADEITFDENGKKVDAQKQNTPSSMERQRK